MRVAVIPCAFEFKDVANQRPINAAKYLASEGFLVIYVPWQWSPEERLSMGPGEVYPLVIQVPMYDFLTHHASLSLDGKSALFVLTLPAPQFVEAVDQWRSKGGITIYDIMDDWEEFYRVGQAPWYEDAVEQELLLKADAVSAVSPALKRKFQHLRTDIAIIGNGYSPHVLGLDQKGASTRGGRRGRIVAGYFGHLTDAWFDWDLLLSTASHFPEYLFELIGYGEPEWVRRRIARTDNVCLLGQVHPSDLHVHVRRWSVGLIPFTQSKLSDAVDPIKIYEYLYFGLPVVVTGIAHLKAYPRTYVADTKSIHSAIAQALADTGTMDDISDFLRSTTWENRIRGIVNLAYSKMGIYALYGN